METAPNLTVIMQMVGQRGKVVASSSSAYRKLLSDFSEHYKINK